MTDERFPSPFEQAEDFYASVPEPKGLVEDILDDAQWDAAQRLDPSLVRVTELRLRLAGPRVVDGFYDPAVEAALAGPLSRELQAASAVRLPQTTLGLVGVSAGSVVLHYRPMVATLQPPAEQGGLEITPADAAVRRVLRLHDLFEQRAEAAAIASFAEGTPALLRGARGVVEALVNFDLDLSATWTSPSGERVRSTLTRRGREYASTLFQREEQDAPVHVLGLVSALDVDGIVTIRRQTHKYRVQVPEELVSDFTLGENVHLLVRATAHVDRVGLRGSTEYTLIERLSLQDPLDWRDLIDPSD